MTRLAIYSRALALLLVLLALAACSRVELFYRNLDWLIPRKVGDYVSLETEQRAWLEGRLAEHLQWHCRHELPRYLDWIERQRPLLAGSPGAEQLEAPVDEARQLLQPTLQRIAPDAARLLGGLSRRQGDELERRLAAEQARLHTEYLTGSPQARLQRRVERARRRFEDWLGPLHPQQQAYLRQWAARHEANVEPWLANRARWQALVLAQLRTPGEARLEPLLASPERYWSADYRHTVASSQAALAELLSELWASATPAQRAHLGQRLDRLRDDLAGLPCAD